MSRSLRCTTDVQELVKKKKKAVSEEYEEISKRTDMGRDLLSLLIRSNMAPDLPAHKRLSDDEILGQITTFVSERLLQLRACLLTRRRCLQAMRRRLSA